MKFCFKILIGLLLFTSCSSDESSDTNDIIIGRWKAVIQYENEQEVSMPTCLPHTFIEYYANKSVSGGKIISDDFPDECNLLQWDLGVVWQNLGNNFYRIGYLNEQGTVFTIFKEGMNLVVINPDGITKTIYEPY